MKLELAEPIGILAEGDISTLRIVCSDMRFQIGEILIIKHQSIDKMFLFRVLVQSNKL